MRRVGALVMVAACAAEGTEGRSVAEDVSSTEQAATVCGSGPTVKGIDVSKWQGDINWSAVAGDGVEFAFIRISDGLNYPDAKFTRNWQMARANGVLRGAYQFFRPAQDANAQADLFLNALGTLEANDLAPVIDVEAADGMSGAQITAGVRTWIERVQAATGRTPIVYTGFYFWRDQVGAPDIGPSPLWHAQYTTAACPNIPPPWSDWALWQYTDSGTVAGISGGVDMNRYNGTRAELEAELMGEVRSCGTIAAAGGTIDDGDACFRAGGPLQSIRRVTEAGEGGDLSWTYATDDAEEANYGQWDFDFAEGGVYRVEVNTPAPYAESKQTVYQVVANGQTHAIPVDQSVSDGWQSLGDFTFAAGPGQFVHVGDNTGETLASQTQIVFDAVRVTRVEADPTDPEPTDPTEPDPSTTEGGCAAGGGASSLLVALGALVLRRRRR